MKLSKKKKEIIKRDIKHILESYTNNQKDYFINVLYKSIIQIIEHTESRSLPQHKLYFTFCEWLGQHLPSYKNIHIWNTEIVHKFLKQTQDITSVAFNNMDQEQFQLYFEEVKKWCAMYIFKSDIETMWATFQETVNT